MNNQVKIDVDNIDDVLVSNIDHTDYPDYCDAFIERAWWKDGTELNGDELDALHDQHRGWVYAKIFEQAIQSL